MSRWERHGFHVLHGVVVTTGVGYFVMKYLMETDDPFSILNHPWQPGFLAAHIVAASVFVAFFGMIFRSHAIPRIRSKGAAHRRSGWTSVLGFSTMALSGYLIQVVSSPAAITVFIWLHIASSAVFVAGYGVHLVLAYRLPSG